MINDARLHRGRHYQRLVNPDELVPDRVQRDHVTAISNFFENALVRRVKRRIFITR